MKEDIEDDNKIIQVNFFDDIEQDDIRKTKWLLDKYTDLIDVIKNYEYSLQQLENGMAADVTANAVLLKDQRHVNYKFYQFLTNNIKFAINNMRDKHEGLIVKLLFLDGMKYLKAQQYSEKGYRKDIPPISATTFADKRRRAIVNIANSLKTNRTLDFVTIDYGRGRNQEGEIGLRMPEIN